MNKSEVLADIAVMMSEFVDNWPNPKRIDTALALIAKTLRVPLAERRLATMCEAFRTTQSGDGKYIMVFKFQSMAAMHEADREWHRLRAQASTMIEEKK
jgi:hypothetical protein